MNRLPGEEQIFHADIKKDFPENIYPTEETLTLKVGARVMFVRNDDQKPRRFYNGKIGVITDIDDGKIFVRCEDGDIEVGRMIWENIRYREDEKTGKIEEEVLGTFTQYPLRLAWAVTIHKSQGLTFDKVIIDAARAFAAGQVYVALSRCRTLEGIVLSTPLDYVELDNDPSVLRYTSDQPTVETVNHALPKAKKEYEVQLFGVSPFGLQIKACVEEIPQRHPEIRIIQLRMMPDHIHVILYVTRTMSVGIMTVVRGLWQGAKKIGRKYTTSINSNNIRDNERCNPNDIRNNESCFPIFTEMPFIRTMSHKGACSIL